MKTLVLCPSRGRPQKAGELRDSFVATRVRDDSRLLFVVDSDDITAHTYEQLGLDVLRVEPQQRGMTGALNLGLQSVLALSDPELEVIGFVGDDHRFRTEGWDRDFLGILQQEGGGIVYGNDLFRHDGDIPTHWFVSRAIVEALGWLALPTCRHLYLDNAWKVIGDGAECLVYVEDIIIEHMHPLAGKAQWDAGYQFVNSPEMYTGDERAFMEWVHSPQMTDDVLTVRRALGK